MKKTTLIQSNTTQVYFHSNCAFTCVDTCKGTTQIKINLCSAQLNTCTR